MDKELRKKIKVDVVNNNIKEVMAMEKNGNGIGAYCLLIDKTIDSLKAIPNSIFLEVVCDITSEITAEKFNHKESVWNKSEQSYNYTEEAQDFFNNKYDEIEHLLIDKLKLNVDMINQ